MNAKMPCILFAVFLYNACDDSSATDPKNIPASSKVPDAIVSAITVAADDCTDKLTNQNPLSEVGDLIDNNWEYIKENLSGSSVTLPTGEQLSCKFTAFDDYEFNLNARDFKYFVKIISSKNL